MLHVGTRIRNTNIHEPRGLVRLVVGRHPAYLEAMNPAHDVRVRRDSLPDENSYLCFHVSSGLELSAEGRAETLLDAVEYLAQLRHMMSVHCYCASNRNGSEWIGGWGVLNGKPTVDETDT